jgi:ribosomal protein S18 acetylase RimI-like enzyme
LLRPDFYVRLADRHDLKDLSRLVNLAPHMYRHLDWNPPLDWLGRQPFLVIDSDEGLQAALAFPDAPPDVAWIRLFVAAAGVDPYQAWQMMFPQGLAYYQSAPEATIAGLGLSSWFINVLERSGFRIHQHIVSLVRDLQKALPEEHTSFDVFVRQMEEDDIPTVAGIDAAAFEPIWQNSADQIRLSYLQSIYATVAEVDGRVVGFQISTSNLFSAHLARLAVSPELQHRRIGMTLIIDAMHKFRQDRLWQLSVNTQDDNHKSLALYRKAGFEPTGEEYPVLSFSR